MKKTRVLFIIAIVCICISAPFLMDIPTYLNVKNGDVVSLDEVEAFGLKKGDAVKGTAEHVLGCCAEEYTTNFGVRTSSKSDTLYYVIWLSNDNFVLYKTSSSAQYGILDNITDQTYDYLESLEVYEASQDYEDIKAPTTSMEIEGTVSKIPSNIEGFFREWYDEAVGDSDFDNCCEPVMITNWSFDRAKKYLPVGIGVGALGVLFLLLSLVSLIKGKKAAKTNEYW